MRNNRSETYRTSVLEALAEGPLCEWHIQRRSKVPYAFLASALLGLLHRGAVAYLGPRGGKGTGKGPSYWWEAVPNIRPLEQTIPDGDGRDNSD